MGSIPDGLIAIWVDRRKPVRHELTARPVEFGMAWQARRGSTTELNSPEQTGEREWL